MSGLFVHQRKIYKHRKKNFFLHSSSDFFEFNSSLPLEYSRDSFSANLIFITISIMFIAETGRYIRPPWELGMKLHLLADCFWAKLRQNWSEIWDKWLDLGKFDWIWQNQTIAAPKTFDLLQLWQPILSADIWSFEFGSRFTSSSFTINDKRCPINIGRYFKYFGDPQFCDPQWKQRDSVWETLLYSVNRSFALKGY